jgi:hypothetical protein
MKFRVSQVSIEPNVRGDEMRRLHLVPLDGEGFAPKDVENPPAPDAHISLLVTPEYAKRFGAGDEFDVIFRERDK